MIFKLSMFVLWIFYDPFFIISDADFSHFSKHTLLWPLFFVTKISGFLSNLIILGTVDLRHCLVITHAMTSDTFSLLTKSAYDGRRNNAQALCCNAYSFQTKNV